MTEISQRRVQENVPTEAVVTCLRPTQPSTKAGEIHGLIMLGVAPAGNHIRSKVGSMGFANGIFLLELQKQEILAEAESVSTVMDVTEAAHAEDDDEETTE